MYAALILLIFATGEQAILRDNLGPYPTQKQCVERTAKMAKSAVAMQFHMPPIVKIGWKCEHTADTGA